MYSAKNKKYINHIKRENDYNYSEDKKMSSSSTQRNFHNKNNLNSVMNYEEDKKLDTYDFFKNSLSKNKNKSFISYYSKKEFKSYNLNKENPQISNYIIRPGHFFSDIRNINRLSKNVTYTIKNPQKEKSKSKNKSNDFTEKETSKNSIINKEDFEDDLSVKTYDLNCTDNNKIYKRKRSSREDISLSRYIKNKRSKISEKNALLQRTSSNASKSISFIMDYSKYDDRDYVCFGSPITYMNKFTENSSTNNAKSPSNSCYYDTSFNVKKESNKIPYKKKEKRRKKIESSRKNFENMRKILKNIDNYFITNGISSKNRELYHQSAIIIQSTFRAYLTRQYYYQELNFLVGIRILLDFLNKIMISRKNFYYNYFFDNLKQYKICNTYYIKKNNIYHSHNKSMMMSLKKTNITKTNNKKQKKDSLKIELCCYLDIISNKKSLEDINIKNNNNNVYQELIILNKKINNEKNFLEMELKRLKCENENLKNNIDRLKENQKSEMNSLTKYKTIQNNIHTNYKNIENVSTELKETNKKKKNIDALNIPILNLKKNFSNTNDGLSIIRNNNKHKKNNNNIYFKKYKKLYLKYLLTKICLKKKQNKIDILQIHLNEMKNIPNKKEIEEKKDEIIQKYKFKIMVENMNFKLKKYIYMCFLEMVCKYLYIKASNSSQSLSIPKSKIITKINKIDDNITTEEEKIINKENEKISKLKKLINNKIKEEKDALHKAFIKLYYQDLINNNNIKNNNNDNKLNNSELILFNEKDFKIKKLQNIVINKIRKDNDILKLIFYKFFYKGIISSIFKNTIKPKEKTITKNIYIKKGYEYKKIFNKNKE